VVQPPVGPHIHNVMRAYDARLFGSSSSQESVVLIAAAGGQPGTQERVSCQIMNTGAMQLQAYQQHKTLTKQGVGWWLWCVVGGYAVTRDTSTRQCTVSGIGACSMRIALALNFNEFPAASADALGHPRVVTGHHTALCLTSPVQGGSGEWGGAGAEHALPLLNSTAPEVTLWMYIVFKALLGQHNDA
jgi:hypothetical protein